MKLEQLTTSLSLSRKLWEKGVRKKSEFCWIKLDGIWEIRRLCELLISENSIKDLQEKKLFFPAPLTDEILEMLPYKIIKKGRIYHLHLFKFISDFRIEYATSTESLLTFFVKEHLPEASGEMLYYLISNKIIKVEEIL